MEPLENRMLVKELLVFPEIQEIIVNETKLCQCDGFIKEIRLDHENRRSARYNELDRIVSFNMQILTDEAIEWADKLITKENLYKRNRNLYANILILITVFHELRHVIQHYKFLIKELDAFEFYLMLMCRIIINSCTQEFYNDNYFLLPSERDAELTAWIKVLKIIEKLNIKPKELFEFQKEFIVLSLGNYDFSEEAIGNGFFLGPFGQLLEKFSYDEYETRKVEIEATLSEYSTYDRVRLGLPIYVDEMDEYAKILKNSKPIDIEKIIVKSVNKKVF